MADANKLPLLDPLLVGPSTLSREYRKRRGEFDHKAVSKKNVEKYLEDGWLHDRKLKKTIRLKKEKVIDERLENRVWCLLYRMGFEELNQGRHFKIKFNRNKKLPVSEKQVDIFAKDGETVVIVECKASKEIKQKQLQKDIETFANLKSYFVKSIRAHYGPEFKPKILWLFVTENIVWSRPDKNRATGENIKILNRWHKHCYHEKKR